MGGEKGCLAALERSLGEVRCPVSDVLSGACFEGWGLGLEGVWSHFPIQALGIED